MGLTRHLDDRLEMMGRMLATTGADLTRLPSGTLDAQFRSAAYRCLGCRKEAQCERWLDEGHAQAAAPAFCPNAQLMNSVREPL